MHKDINNSWTKNGPQGDPLEYRILKIDGIPTFTTYPQNTPIARSFNTLALTFDSKETSLKSNFAM